jgi:hypothetical protein
MLKTIESEDGLTQRAIGALKTLLLAVPAIRLDNIEVETRRGDHQVDLVAHINLDGRPHSLAICR